MFVTLSRWTMWKGNPEYPLHTVTQRVFPDLRSALVSTTSPFFWEDSVPQVLTPFAAQHWDKSTPGSHQEQLTTRAKSYSGWLVALHGVICGWGSDREIVSGAALICLNHELILSDSSTVRFPVLTTGTGVGFSPFPSTALIRPVSSSILQSEGGRSCAACCLWTQATAHNETCI